MPVAIVGAIAAATPAFIGAGGAIIFSAEAFEAFFARPATLTLSNIRIPT